MADQNDKKPFAESGFGKFLNKAAGVVPTAVAAAGALVTGNIPGAIEAVRKGLQEKSATDSKARELLQELELKQGEWAVELARIDAGDRHSAREREVEVLKAGGRNTLQFIVGMVNLGMFVGAFLVICFIRIPAENQRMFDFLMGTITGTVMGLNTYYFGSSIGSRNKEKAMLAER